MREIKFRAWDGNKMLASPAMYEEYGVLNYAIQACIRKGQTLMQYTGLKDKNGKEIYEGDILNTYGNNIGIVKYEIGVFGIGFVCNIYHWSHEAIIDTADVKKVDREWGRSEIIGNIYENPELLK